ncbi:hypothetical protein LCGC14_2297420, partial [marine sediment metagenome]
MSLHTQGVRKIVLGGSRTEIE